MITTPRKDLKRLTVDGRCPDCNERVRGWVALPGKNAATWAADKLAKGIDAQTGHKIACLNK